MLFTGSKQELFEFLTNFDFDSVRTTPLSEIVFKVNFKQEANDYIEYLHFSPFEDVWFESPYEIRQFNLNQSELEDYIKELYESYNETTINYEKTMQKGDIHYDIDYPQVFPFLPDTDITILEAISEEKLLEL